MKETLKLALEALETLVRLAEHEGWEGFDKQYNAIKAIKEALAQPEQSTTCGEPVAWMDIDEKGAASGLRYWSEPDNRHEVALYTTPPQRTWIDLTEDEVTEIVGSSDYRYDVARAAEAKSKEKNI